MNRLNYILSGMLMVCLFYGCVRHEPIEIYRLDECAFSGEMPDSEGYAGVELWKAYCGKGEEDADSFWTDYCNSRAVEVFYPDVESRMNQKIPEIELALGKVRANFRKYLPDVSFPKKIYAVVSPYSQSIMLGDSIAIIALNHYLGEDYAGYSGMPGEQKLLKVYNNIGVDLAEALIRSRYEFAGNSWSPLMSKMLYEGGVVIAVKKVTDAGSPQATGVSEENYKLLDDNEKEIWKSLVENGLLYDSSPKVADELIKPYPGKRYPSRTARFFGLKITESAIKNGISMEELLSPDFYLSDEALYRSGYSPVG